MLPDPGSLRQVEGNKAPPPANPRESLDAPNARRSLRDRPVEEEKDNLGIEDADPRWSKRELVLKRLDVPPGDPDALLHLSGDATDFRGQPGDPFEVLIKRREERRKRSQRGTPEIAVKLETGLAPLDAVLDGLEGRLYAISGPLEAARILAHQIACEVARDHPVVYAAHGQAARDLTLQALGRLSGDRAPGDLARARAVADAFRPIRENVALVEMGAQDTVARLRARLQGLLTRRQVKHGMLVIADLLALVTGGSRSLSAAAKPAWSQRAKDPSSGRVARPAPLAGGRVPPGWVPGAAGAAPAGRGTPGAAAPPPEPAAELQSTVPAAPVLAPEVLDGAVELAQMAYQLGLPAVAVFPADLAASEGFAWPADLPDPVRLVLSEPGQGGALTLTVHRPQARQLRPRSGDQAPPELSLVYNPRRIALEPAAPGD